MAGTKKTENLEQDLLAGLDLTDPKVLETLRYLSTQSKKIEIDPDAERHKRLQESEKIRAEQLTEIRLFKDGDKYKDDVYVGYNGQDYLIKRGVTVKVPVAVAEIVYRAEQQRSDASEMSKGLQDSYLAKAEKL